MVNIYQIDFWADANLLGGNREYGLDEKVSILSSNKADKWHVVIADKEWVLENATFDECLAKVNEIIRNGSVRAGCAYEKVCGDDDRVEPRDGRKERD